MADLLAPHRKNPVSAAAETKPPKGTDEYVAFDAKDKVLCLTIFRANDPARSPQYPFLLDVVYDSSHFTNFVLVYTTLMVLVRGENLKPVVDALKMKTADFIQEFDPQRWEKPKDKSAPFIQSIQVVVQQSGQSIPDSENLGKNEPGRSLH